MRLLHARHRRHHGSLARPASESDRGRDPRRAVGQSLPLHRVSQHRRGGDESGGAAAGGGGPMTEARTIGAALPRKEDFRLITGQGRYLDDIAVANCLHVHFVRSPHAHARIVAIDCEAARAAEGVVAVVTGRELAEWTTPLRMAPPIEGLEPAEFPGG